MLDLISFTSILIIILSAFQTILGIGILVLGTPILLLMNFEMLEIMTVLLPLSILNSLLNIFYLRSRYSKIKIDNILKKEFFLICLPGIFLGLVFLKFLNNYINFNIFVGLVILVVLFLSLKKKKNNLFVNGKIKKGLILLTGFIHGITNSGGSLLSLLIIKSVNESMKFIRYQITFFYFFLAFFQLLIILFIFDINLLMNIKINYFLSLILGVVLGNILFNKINSTLIKNLYFFIFLSSIFLLYQS